MAQTRLRLRENLHLIDIAILGLAFTSLLVFLLDRTRSLPQGEEAGLRFLDLSLVVLYAGAYLTKWFLAPAPIRWLRRNWINAVGALPLTINVLGFAVADRYFLVVQVIIVVLRAGEALDRAFGARILEGLFERYRSMVVEELADPLLMRLALVLEDAVTSRDYAAAIGKRLDERRDLVEAAVKRAISASPKLSRLSQFGPVERWIDETTDEIVDAAHAALTGPEINLLIREGLQDAFAELKQGIAEKKWREKGVGVADVALGVVRS
jgi:hypothetical protein